MTTAKQGRTPPKWLLLIFLLAVTALFMTFAFAMDVFESGREPRIRFWLELALSGVLSIACALLGMWLRRGFWLAVLPTVVGQLGLFFLLRMWLPNLAEPVSTAQQHGVQGGFALDALAMATGVCVGYMAFLFVFINVGRSFWWTRTEMEQLEGEMAAANEVQRVILPEFDAAPPGFRVETIYKPARHLGGDFFQVLPAADAGLLVVIGDVAGKGLPAAMHVSLLVGGIRAIAPETRDPVTILSRLNQVLLGRSPDGFATAIAAFIASNGEITLASAGHLFPYLDGHELELPGALPLGVSDSVNFEAVISHLSPGGRLTFISDGVVEAMDETGALFGFKRAEALSLKPAAAIADAAIRFGQKDDITVVTVERESDFLNASSDCGLRTAQ